MPRARNLKKNLLLPLQNNLAIVRPPRQIHQPVELRQLFPRQRSLCNANGRLFALLHAGSRLSCHTHLSFTSNASKPAAQSSRNQDCTGKPPPLTPPKALF